MSEINAKKHNAHVWFDKLWKNHEERDVYYRRLAEELDIDYDKCHFATMSEKELDRAIVIIKKWWFEKYDI